MPVLYLFFLFFVTINCQSNTANKEKDSAEYLFKSAIKLKNSRAYLEALEKLRDFKSRHLYSPLTADADLAIADIYFAQKNWKKAVSAYTLFLERHPKHKEKDRASYTLALSYFHQIPSTADRDLSLSGKTLTHFNRYLKQNPKGCCRSQAVEHKEKIFYLLAKKEWMTAHFYLKQGKTKSALYYLNNLLNKHTNQIKKKTEGLPDLPELKKLISRLNNSQTGA